MSYFKWKIFSNFVAFSEYPNFKRPLKSVVHSANRFVKITAPVTRLLTFNCRAHKVLSHGAELNAHILWQKLFYPRRPSFHEINCFKFLGLFQGQLISKDSLVPSILPKNEKIRRNSTIHSMATANLKKS